MDNNKEVIRFIDRLYRDLYLSDEVLHHSTGDITDKYRNLKEYLDMLKELHERASLNDHRKKILKDLYHKKYVIEKEDISEKYYKTQERRLLDEGHGHIKLSRRLIKKYQDNIIENQIRTLDEWLDYLLSDDANVYPFWAKYWAFQGMLRIGSFNVVDGTITKRTKDTVAPFIDLNVEALSLSIDMIMKKINKENIDDKDLEDIIKNESFQRIYTYIISKYLNNKIDNTKKNKGKWIKYNRGSDHLPLVKSLRGYHTGWCTAGSFVAKSQLKGGDFYVYYTLDKNDEYKIPRIALRMDGSKIGEIRGIATKQNLEPEMISVVDDKIRDFPDREEYYRKVNNMKRLTSIYNNKDKKDLSVDDLRFLYELDHPMEGFGFRRDPRVAEIISCRDMRKDFSTVFNCSIDKVVSNENQINDNTKVYLGNLELNDYKSLSEKPEIMLGNIDIGKRKIIKNVVFPKQLYGKITNGKFNFGVLKHAINVKFPETMENLLIFSCLDTAINVIFPKHLSSRVDLNLHNLKIAYNVIMPNEIQSLHIYKLKRANNFVLPREVHVLYLSNLESAEGITMPNKAGFVDLQSLKNGKGLFLPDSIDRLLISKAAFDDIGLDTIRRSVTGCVDIKYKNGYNEIIELNQKEKDWSLST